MDRGTQALITTIVFTVLAGIFIILRSISRFFVVKRPGVEDYLIIFAFILSIGLCINVDLQKDNGLGKHTADLALHQVVTTLKVCEEADGAHVQPKPTLAYQPFAFCTFEPIEASC